MVSDAGIQVDFIKERTISVVPANPPPPPPPIQNFQSSIPTPITSFSEMLKLKNEERHISRKQTSQEENYQIVQKPLLEITKRPENTGVVGELTETLGRNVGEYLKPSVNRQSRVAINEKSSPEDVTRWLQEKGFSPRVIDLLDGQDGGNLFSLTKLNLQQACGRDEGSYLYSQLLVQKKRSGYRTHTGDELKAILNQRKTHVELSNEAAPNEPIMSVH